MQLAFVGALRRSNDSLGPVLRTGLSAWTSQAPLRLGDLGIVIVGFEVFGLAGYESVQSVNPVAGETNDGYLSDIRARPITQQHVLDAIEGARGGAVDEGVVGAGTGTGALGFKAGIGTSSRKLGAGPKAGVVAALVQANFSGTLTVSGVPIARRAPWQRSTRSLRRVLTSDVGTRA